MTEWMGKGDDGARHTHISALKYLLELVFVECDAPLALLQLCKSGLVRTLLLLDLVCVVHRSVCVCARACVCVLP